MKVKYYETEEGSSVISGEVIESVDFAEKEKAEIKFSFWWDHNEKTFSVIDRGELRYNGRALAYFWRHGNLGSWNLKEHRDNYPEYSELTNGVIEKLEKELKKKYS